MSVKLASTLPKDVTQNGMYVLHSKLVKQPERRHIVVMVVDCARTTIDHAGEEEYTPTAGILFIEPITDRDDQTEVLEALARARAGRTGDGVLDFDFGVTDPLAETIRQMADDGVTVSFRAGGEDE